MKWFCSLLVALAAGAAWIPTADAQFNRNRNDRDEVCIYHDNYYQGTAQCFYAGDEITDLGRLSRNVSSIHVYGRARVTLYEGANFQGNSIDFTSDVVDLARVSLSGSQSWNDRARSLRITSDTGRYRSDRPTYNDRPGNRRGQQQASVCVYQDANFRGRSECWSAGDVAFNLADENFGDRISSIQVFGGARVVLYTNAGYGGARLVVDRDIPDLARVPINGGAGVSWNDQVSSLQVDGARNRGRAYGRRDRDYDYDYPVYRDNRNR